MECDVSDLYTIAETLSFQLTHSTWSVTSSIRTTCFFQTFQLTHSKWSVTSEEFGALHEMDVSTHTLQVECD